MSTATAMPPEVRKQLGPEGEQLLLAFDSFLPVDKDWFSTKEVADLLGVNEKSIRSAFDNNRAAKRLLGLGFNFEGSTDRVMRHIPRAFLLLYLLKAANFTLPIFRANAEDTAGNLSTRFLDIAIEEFTKERARRKD